MKRFLVFGLIVMAFLQPVTVHAASNKVADIQVGSDGVWVQSMSAKPGQDIAAKVVYKNNTKKVQKQAWVKTISLSPNVTDHKNALAIYNSKYPNSTRNITYRSDGNIKLGTVNAGDTATLLYNMIMPPADKLQCGTNTVRQAIAVVVPETDRTYTDTVKIKVNKTCPPKAPTKPKPAPAQPVYGCKGFTVNTGSGGSAGIENFVYTARNGATYKNATVNWGDGTITPHDLRNVDIHVYRANKTYPVTMRINFALSNNESRTVTCTRSVTITSISSTKTTSTGSTAVSNSNTTNTMTTVPATTAPVATTTTDTATDTADDDVDTATAGTTTDQTAVAADTTADTADTADTDEDTTQAEPASNDAADVEELPNTGAGVSLVVFGMMVVAGAVGYQFWLRRRYN